jgi:Predicted DNA-binding proteins
VCARFVPDDVQTDAQISLSVDEYEVIRLIDYEAYTQEQCAAQIGVARTTVTEIYDRARKKIAAALVEGSALVIGGGHYSLCSTAQCRMKCRRCVSRSTVALNEKGGNIMRIAVTYDNGNIFQHFGHTEQFKVYDTEDGKVVSSQVVSTNGQGHGALAAFLFSGKVDALICGGIGGGAQTALAEAGIKLYGGVSGSADEAVAALLSGNLEFNPNVRCSHHDENHGEGHTCGSHGCGNHGCH